MNQEVLNLIEELKKQQNLDDVDWLSEAIIKLAVINYSVNMGMAQAELGEKEVLVKLLNAPLDENQKKISVAEAENRAVVETKNLYGEYKTMAIGVMELIQSIKKRLEVLSFERKIS